jgi:hypothetical protein
VREREREIERKRERKMKAPMNRWGFKRILLPPSGTVQHPPIGPMHLPLFFSFLSSLSEYVEPSVHMHTEHFRCLSRADMSEGQSSSAHRPPTGSIYGGGGGVLVGRLPIIKSLSGNKVLEMDVEVIWCGVQRQPAEKSGIDKFKISGH